jgi:hypothetical protein
MSEKRLKRSSSWFPETASIESNDFGYWGKAAENLEADLATIDPSSATLTGVNVTFFTHNDDKDSNTSVSVSVENKVSLFFSELLASLNDFAGNQGFGDNPPSTYTFALVLASQNITMSSITTPTFTITIAPTGHDRWIFDVTFTFAFSDNTQFTSGKTGIILDQDNRIYTGSFSD